MLIPFFYRIYGDKRSAVARQVAAFKGQSPNMLGRFTKGRSWVPEVGP